MTIIDRVRAAFRRLVVAAALASEAPKTYWERVGLKPEVCAAFESALAPQKRRESPSWMGRTSRGRNWYPRIAWAASEKQLQKRKNAPKHLQFESAVMLRSGVMYLRRHGTLYRVSPEMMAAGSAT